ncbi:hypothetical protein FRC10_001390 [Ceratobasidium sp. 414]|nr:hypothetical protein FRC10_001390 [Ceratobasidium sp. 414]
MPTITSAELNVYSGDNVVVGFYDQTNTRKVANDTNTIIKYLSFSTLGVLSHIMGIETIKAYLPNKTSPAKLDLLRHGQPEAFSRQLETVKPTALTIRINTPTKPFELRQMATPRDFGHVLLQPVTWFPCREIIDAVEEVTSSEVFEYSLDPVDERVTCWVEFGMALLGCTR